MGLIVHFGNVKGIHEGAIFAVFGFHSVCASFGTGCLVDGYGTIVDIESCSGGHAIFVGLGDVGVIGG